MNNRFNKAVKLLALVAAMTAASAASAQSAGNWLATLGANQITPKVDSGDVSAPALPGTKADVKSDTQPRFAIAYMYSDNISTEIDLGLPYKHELVGAGAIQGTGKLGTSEVLPPAAFIQYRFFQPNTMFRPYAGQGATFKIDDKWAACFQLGLTAQINEKWFLDASVIKTKLKTAVHFSTGQNQDVRLDPLSVNVSIGYRFKGF